MGVTLSKMILVKTLFGFGCDECGGGIQIQVQVEVLLVDGSGSMEPIAIVVSADGESSLAGLAPNLVHIPLCTFYILLSHFVIQNLLFGSDSLAFERFPMTRTSLLSSIK
jgi:hypothetical protein